MRVLVGVGHTYHPLTVSDDYHRDRGWASSNQLKALQSTPEASLRRSHSGRSVGTRPRASKPPARPTELRLSSLHNCVSHFLEIIFSYLLMYN